MKIRFTTTLIIGLVVSTILTPGIANAESQGTDQFVIDLRQVIESNYSAEARDSRLIYSLEEEQGSGAERYQLIENRSGDAGLVARQYIPKADETVGDPSLQGDVNPGFTDEQPLPVEEFGGSTILDENPEGWEPSFSYGVTSSTATFLWDRAIGNFSLSTDAGVNITSSDQQIVLENLKPGQRHTVTLRGETPNSAGEIVATERIVNFSTLPVAELDKLEPLDDSLITPLVYQSVSTQLTYRTFIPGASAPGAMCNWGDSTWSFDGDNRSWSLPNTGEPFNAPSSRSIMMVASNWMQPVGQRLYKYKNVGASVSRKNNVVQSTTYASMNNMLFQNAGESSALTQVRLNHAAANPHCALFDVNYGGTIQYNVMTRLYRSGTVEVDGYRRPVPNHEIYAGLDSAPVGSVVQKKYYAMYKGTNSGFHCLIGGICADQLINKSVSN
ncbi:hypothetical protein ACXR2W_08575 [Leucobacter sp. HY1908]